MFYHRMCRFVFFLSKDLPIIVLLQPLETDLVRTNNKCILGFASDNLSFVRTKAASNGCKKTLWKKNSYGIYYIFLQNRCSRSVTISKTYKRLFQPEKQKHLKSGEKPIKDVNKNDK